jgi:GNAT superfamily N-acetyltransferase
MDSCASEQRMDDPEQELSSVDLARIAALHVESIDDSLPSLLGVSFARLLYRFLDRSDQEIVFVERIDSRVESVCVVSYAPATLHGRIVRATFPLVVWRAVVALLTRPVFRAMVWNLVRDAIRGGDHDENAPEITYVFTNREMRGRSLGRRIVERVDSELAARGFERYFVKTIDDPSNRAVQFYAENGFECLGPRVEGGRTFVEFRKLLAAR